MLKLAMLLDNPGEPAPTTRYREPGRLRDLGYNAMVLWESTGLSGVESPEAVPAGEMRRWVEGQFDLLHRRIEAARDAGLAVYLAYDVLSLTKDVVAAGGETLACKRRPEVLCPASDALMDRVARAMECLIAGAPPIDGVVVRFGDSDAARVPYLAGNDVYSPHCPRCSDLSRADRVARIIERCYEVVVGRLDLRLIVRAWNVRPGGMHDSVALCEQLRDRLPGEPDDPRLMLSFKFTETDFWRYQRWNPASLVFGSRPILYELQCQREFEGKGAVPNWQAPLWRDGMPEWSARERSEPAEGDAGDGDSGSGSVLGLAEVSERVNLAGLWAWVRGGGWGGPFIENEAWIDANVVAVPRLADDPKSPLGELASSWVRRRLGVTQGETASVLRQILEASPDFVLQGFYLGPYARGRRDSWRPNGDWIQDDLLDAEAAWRIVNRLSEAGLDEAVAEKQEAVERIGRARAALQRIVDEDSHAVIDPLVNTLIYSESLFEAFRDLIAGLVAYRRFKRKPSAALKQQCRQRLLAAQGHWNHHTQRHASLLGAATPYRERNFWEVTQRMLDETFDAAPDD